MVHTRRLAGVLAGAFVTTCLCGVAAAQTLDLSRQQRDLVQSMIAAVDAATAGPDSGATLQTHLMRASDGSHYVAYTIELPSSLNFGDRPALYIRLADATATRPERSPLREWLATNQRSLPAGASTRGIAIGDMPIMGVTGNLGRRQATTPEMATLNALDLERRRARERREEDERKRGQEAEGRRPAPSDTLTFEDFDLAPAMSPRSLRRALTSGPGDFVLFVAWADRTAKPPAAVQVLKKRLTLPTAPATFGLSSIILADAIRPLPAAYKPQQQASHPYSIGTTEIAPAADAVLRDNEELSVVFQVINPRAGDDGKPDVAVAFQVVRVQRDQEEAVATLPTQDYSSATLPPEFDVRAGHPLFVTAGGALSSLKAGAYRLKINASDRIASRLANATLDFTVAATPAALLRQAPPLGVPFRRELVLDAETMQQVLGLLRPSRPSAALDRAFELAASGRFVDLMVDEAVDDAEAGVRAALGGLARFALGDGTAAVQFQRAQLLGAPAAATRYLSGAARALQRQDGDAIAAWQDALKAGAPRALVAPQLRDAHLRRNNVAAAAAIAVEPPSAWSPGGAALLIATNRLGDAITRIEARLAVAPDDHDARWLLLHAMFAELAGSAASPARRADFRKEATTYIDAGGPHAAVAAAWLESLSPF